MIDLPASRLRRIALLGLAVVYPVAGVMHFVVPEVYLGIMPPALPAPLLLVYLSGAAEILLGLAVLVPRLRPWAGWGLVALLAAIFPANVHMALNAEAYAPIPAAALWLRLPLQAVLMAWAVWATRPVRQVPPHQT